MKKRYLLAAVLMAGFSQTFAQKNEQIRLITLDPGHFHAALVQKNMFPNVSAEVKVYAPQGKDLDMHLARINGYNTRVQNPTAWKEILYTSPDFFEKMVSEKAGNVVVMAGNNKKKTEYIKKAIDAGFNVLADKPMVIDPQNFDMLKAAFESAKKKGVLLYDIMTERSEITTMLQREFSMDASVFGTLQKGTPENPAVTKESVHHFWKYVSGSVLTRPAWFMDVAQQGEGIVDVNTHLVDLIQWECFPEQIIDYKKDIKLTSAKRWSTDMTLTQFKEITQLEQFPQYLQKDVNGDVLKVYSNGEINYTIKGVHAKASVIWAYKAPEGGGDTHYSIMRGTKANLVIRQGAEQKYQPVLSIEPLKNSTNFEKKLVLAVAKIAQKYPGIEVQKTSKGWDVIVPDKYKDGHEAHFGLVAQRYMQYLKDGKLPVWEVPNMLAKYYTTTEALKLAQKTK
ncbi:putative oxidoreductase C-terminal domain-containing protein [Flectobacillus roseus]|uniref:putative oxidoreductase C-terminal domain-containing protein n=1 Tax=Flectobacillus roseus TaxID=502259 RepID=UPI0024B73BDE|nr:putative oxidoreductase C-terminal domain-containing protein [Flectobacillus roseus]MDI9867803.1 putative oxidoreductase C-terminal domain-containing protein [Flectobacillus roseus]